MGKLPLLSLLPVEHKMGVEALSDRHSLRPGLVKIVITKTQGNEVTKFYLPVQWTPHEAAYLLHEIRGVTWQLGDDGIPVNYLAVTEICKKFCDNR